MECEQDGWLKYTYMRPGQLSGSHYLDLILSNFTLPRTRTMCNDRNETELTHQAQKSLFIIV